MKGITTRDLTRMALFVALITAGTFIRIPLGEDYFTLQFFFTLLAGLVLGARLGALAVLTYVILGLVGVPVFASGGGLSYLVKPTFGYLIGFILQAYFCGHFAERVEEPSFRKFLLINAGGMAIVYLIGLPWLYLISNYVAEAPMTLWAVIFYSGILQVPPDFFLCILAAWAGVRCHKMGFRPVFN